MKKIKKPGLIIACILAVISSVNTVSAQSQTNFIIHGSFKDMPVPAKIYLIYAPFLNQPADSAVVKDGKYEFKGYTEEATGADLSLTVPPDPKSQKDKATIILDKGELNIVSTGSLNQVDITGSGAKATADFKSAVNKNQEEILRLNKAMASDSFKNDPDYQKAIIGRFRHMLMSSMMDFISFARNNPKSPVSPYLTYVLISSNLVLHAMCDTLAQNVPDLNKPTKLHQAILDLVAKQKEQDNKAATINKALDDKAPPEGSKAPDFTQTSVDGKPVSLSSFKGKYVLIDFWASWCAPCRAENPNVVKAYDTYKGKGFTILGVSLDGKSTKAAWLAAIQKDGLTWTEVSDLSGWSNEAAKLYGVHAIPQNFLIDPNGNIIGKNLRGEELNKKLASIFH